MLASTGISCRRVSVCPSCTSRCSIQTAKHRIIQITPHDSPGTLVFWCRKSPQNSNWITPNRGTKCRWGWGRLNAGVVAANWGLSTQCVVNLVRSQIYHTERPPDLFAARLSWWRTSRGFVSDSWSLLDLTVHQKRLVARYSWILGQLIRNAPPIIDTLTPQHSTFRNWIVFRSVGQIFLSVKPVTNFSCPRAYFLAHKPK